MLNLWWCTYEQQTQLSKLQAETSGGCWSFDKLSHAVVIHFVLGRFYEKNALIMISSLYVSCFYVIIMIMIFIKLEPPTKTFSSAHWTKLKCNLHPVEIPWVKNYNNSDYTSHSNHKAINRQNLPYTHTVYIYNQQWSLYTYVFTPFFSKC